MVAADSRPLRKSQPAEAFELKTVTTVFELLVCNKALSKITGFPEGCELTRANASVMQTDGPCAPTTPIT